MKNSKIISFYNNKGGTGKTSACLNLAKTVTDLGYSVLLIDLDPQANLTYWIYPQDIEWEDHIEEGVTNIFACSEGFDIIPNSKEPEFRKYSMFNDEDELVGILKSVSESYDFIFIDCPPSFSIDVEIALSKSFGVIIPLVLDALSLEGVRQVLLAIEKVGEKTGREPAIIGVLPSLVNSKRKLSGEVVDYIKNEYDLRVFKNYIPVDVRMAEAPSFGESIIAYAPSSTSAKKFKILAQEVLNLLS